MQNQSPRRNLERTGLNRFVKLLLAVFFLGLSSTYAHFSQQAQREGEAQAVLILSLVRRGLYSQAATQINDLVKKQLNPKFRFDYQTFDTAYISKKSRFHYIKTMFARQKLH